MPKENQPKFTPGPWSVNNWPQGDAEIRIGAAGTPRIATFHLRHVSIVQQRANAHLAAAAPELYTALQKIDANAAESVEWIRRVARAALAKAEGGGS